MLEPLTGKLVRAVLRRGGEGNLTFLSDSNPTDAFIQGVEQMITIVSTTTVSMAIIS
jgi:hypothetical protein